MARALVWVTLPALMAAFFSFYLDTPVPEEIPEKTTVQLIDAFMRTYVHLVNGLVMMGVTDYFSRLHRQIADWFILIQTTGRPWGLSFTDDQTLEINDTHIQGVRVRIYEPVSTIYTNQRPVMVFLHGGGWSLLSVDSYDPLIRKIARESGLVIVSVDYRLSPDYPYPAPLEDSISVVNYIIDNPSEFRIDPNRVAVGGDSAGGNMAASIALQLRNKVAMQLLIVPILQMLNFKTASFLENSPFFHDSVNSPESLVLITNYLGISPMYYLDFLQNKHTSAELRHSRYMSFVDQKKWMKPEFVRNWSLVTEAAPYSQASNQILARAVETKLTDPLLAPLMAEESMLRDLPEVYIVTCGYDFIRDDGVMYAQRLSSVGTKVIHKHYQAGFHHAWFFSHGPLKLDVAVEIVSDLIDVLIKHL